MTLVDPATDAPLARLLPIDKIKNASGRRKVIGAASAVAQPPPDPMPALLRK